MTGVKKTGFTLIELLVTTAIFLSLVMSVTTIFLLTRRAERTTLADQVLTSELRLASQIISREITQGKILYGDWLTSTSGSLSEIRLTDISASQTTIISLNGDRIQISHDAGQTWADLTSADVTIDQLSFYIQPRVDPTVIENGQYLSNQQPFVTLLIKGRLASDPNSQDLLLQTTASSRLYQR